MRRPTVRFRRNSGSGIPLITLGLIAVGAAVKHQSPLVAALGGVLIVIPIAAYALLVRSVRSLDVSRSAPESAVEGDEVRVKVRIRNGSRIPLFLPRASEIFGPELRAQKDVLFPYHVRAGQDVEESYQGLCALPRGIYELGPLSVAVSDPLGWFEARKEVAGSRTLKVYPRFQPFGVKERLGESHSHVLDDITRSVLGESTEYLSVRDYRAGDPLRKIHWGLTAHRGFPVVRELSRESRGDLCIFLDLYRYAFLGVGRGSSLEQSVEIAAALSAHALRRGNGVRLVAQGAARLHTPGGTSPGHLQTVLDALVEVKPDGVEPLDDVLAREARRARPGSTAVIMVSPYLRPSSRFEGSLRALRRNGVRVVLVVFDETTYVSLYEHRPTGDPARDYVARVRKLGMEAHPLPCGAALKAVLSKGQG